MGFSCRKSYCCGSVTEARRNHLRKFEREFQEFLALYSSTTSEQTVKAQNYQAWMLLRLASFWAVCDWCHATLAHLPSQLRALQWSSSPARTGSSDCLGALASTRQTPLRRSDRRLRSTWPFQFVCPQSCACDNRGTRLPKRRLSTEARKEWGRCRVLAKMMMNLLFKLVTHQWPYLADRQKWILLLSLHLPSARLLYCLCLRCLHSYLSRRQWEPQHTCICKNRWPWLWSLRSPQSPPVDHTRQSGKW